MTTVLERLDWIVLGIYFLALILVAVWVVLQKNKNTEDYFLAGRNVGWFVIGASIFASNIGSEHVVGLAGTGFESGTPMAHYELHAWIVLLLGWLFLPFYIRSGAFTMPEFLEKRFPHASGNKKKVGIHQSGKKRKPNKSERIQTYPHPNRSKKLKSLWKS